MSERGDAQRLDDAIAALLTGAPIESVLSRADRDLAPYLRAFSQLQALQPPIPPPSEEFRLRLRARFVQGANHEARVARGRGGRFQRAAVAGAASLILGSAINPALAHELVNHVRQTMGRAAADVLNAALFVERQVNLESQLPQQPAAESNAGNPHNAEFADSQDEHGQANVPSEAGEDFKTPRPSDAEAPANPGEAHAQPGGSVTNIPEQAPGYAPGPPGDAQPPRDDDPGEPAEPASAAPPIAGDPPNPRAEETSSPGASELPKPPEKPGSPEGDHEGSHPLVPPPAAGNPVPPAAETPVVEEPGGPAETPGEPGGNEGEFDPADNSAASDGPPGLDGDLPPGHGGEAPGNSESNGNGNVNGPPEHIVEHVVEKGDPPGSVRAASNGNSPAANSPGNPAGKNSTQHGPESASANGNGQGTPAPAPKTEGKPKSYGPETRSQSPASTPSNGNGKQPQGSGANEPGDKKPDTGGNAAGLSGNANPGQKSKGRATDKPGHGGSGDGPEPEPDEETGAEPDRDLSHVRGTNRGSESSSGSKSHPRAIPGNR